MKIELIEDIDIKKKVTLSTWLNWARKNIKDRKIRKQKEKYVKFAKAISKEVIWLKEQIAKSSDKNIRIRVKDIVNIMGQEFSKKSDIVIYRGLKFVLFHEGIVVNIGMTKDKDKLLIMRFVTPYDKLSPIVNIYIQ